MRAYSPIEVANWFIRHAEKNGERLDPMKLLKLVYLAHGWHLAVRDEPLINETVEAWQHGPVVPSVYHRFKQYGSRPIDRPAKEYRAHEGQLVEPMVVPGDAETTDVLERVWQVYGPLSGLSLSALTHQPGSPWDEAWRDAQRKGKVRGMDIPDAAIQRHFVEIAGGDSGREEEAGYIAG